MFSDAHRAKLAAEAEELLARDDYGADAQTRVGEIQTALEADNAGRAKVEEIRQAYAEGRVIETPGAPEASPVFLKRAEDPWTGDQARAGNDHPTALRDRARVALERLDGADRVPDEGRAKVAHLLDHDEDSITARWALATGNPSYERAFRKLVKHPGTDGLSMLEPDEQRALSEATKVRTAMSLTSANGGYMVPFTLDPTVILTNSGTVNPVRRISRVVTSPTNVWHGVSSAGVSAEWLGEGSEAADASPTLSQPTVTCAKGAAYLQASFELVHDSSIGDEVTRLMVDAKDRLEATAHMTGTGSGQPKGIATVIANTTASRVAGSSGAAGAADFVIADTYAVLEALPARWRPNASWIASLPIINKCRRFNEGTTGANASFLTTLAGGQPPDLIGKPLFEASEMDSTVVSGSNDDVLILGDFSAGFLVVDVVGTTLAYEPLVKGSNRRPTGEVGWFMFFRSGSDDVTAGAAFRGLRL